ncbi:MAG TPA: exodeoxyribonuclease III [Terriglobia bacterium]|nr:exodeoxyribonuclease III [Terriglobia bacterium]
MKKSKPSIRLYCWNVNGIRAVQKKGFFPWFCGASPDILCLQETKAQTDQLEKSLVEVEGYESYWCSAERKGYSGVATYTRRKPLSVKQGFGIPEFDSEGRVLITEFPEFTLFNVYFPNGKRDQVRLDFKMEFYRAILQHWEGLRKAGKRLVICGDYNTAHKEIDLARPKENATVSGFLPIEREWMDGLVRSGYVDTFRLFNQAAGQYTWWDMMTRARERNVGWRLDYFFVSQDLTPKVNNAWICPEVMGSDHCPIGLELEL